ncbi:MAG TPA: cytochrome c [Burkholderiales bacterium]|nr:cytochrome c [Burkholderiales bacterium]
MVACTAQAGDGGPYGLGQPAADAVIRAWDIDVRADGAGLPQGHGNAARGERIYAGKCAACHGDRGRGKPMDRLVGDHASLAGPAPVKTVGSYWPFATTLFDYVRRAMPFNAPRTLSDDEVYAVVAYVLHLNGILGADATLDAASLPLVTMPNRDGFVGDPRPDVHAGPCAADCR